MQRINLAIIALLIFTGCSSSKITSSWKTKNLNTHQYRKILVLGIIKDSDRSIQEKMERHLVGDLLEHGQNAVSSFAEYGPKGFSGLSEKTLLEKIKKSDFDAIITIVLLDKKKESRYVPASVQNSPYRFYQNEFNGYYGAIYNRIYEPGYYVTDTKYFWESNLYDLATNKLLYSVQTQSFDPGNSERLGHEYGLVIIHDMIKNEILPGVINAD